MSTILDRTPWEGLFPVDAITPMTGVHQGIEYRGEVIRASRWSPQLGESLGVGSHFKIVLLQERPKVGLPVVVNLRIAVCVPAASSGREVHRIVGEITAAKRAAYLTRRDVDAAAIDGVFRERRHDLDSRLISEESARFGKGVICVHGGSGPNPRAIFSADNPDQWIGRLAGRLLARSYPNLPVDTGNLPNPIRSDDAARIFASVSKQAGSDPKLLGYLGPALGLSSPDSGYRYDPSGCRVFTLIRKMICDGPAPFGEIHRFLAFDVGLTDELASLFLLLFVRHERPEHQIQLKDDVGITLADSTALLGSRLTPDLIPLVAWDTRLPDKATTIGPATAPRLIDARHHLSVVCPELPSTSGDGAEAALTRSIASIAGDIGIASRILDALEASSNSGPDATRDTGKLRSAIARLGQISGQDYEDLYHSIRAIYPSLLDLRHDLETLRQLVKLDEDAEEIFQAREYIAESRVPTAKFPHLAVDRDALLTSLSPAQLTRSRGRGWSAVARDAEGFKIRYIQAYREHHRQFHDRLPSFQVGLLEARKKCAALDLLNTICELGPPSGAGLEETLAALDWGPQPCSLLGPELGLSDEPCCRECQINLDQTVPSAELARLTPRVDMALNAKTQKLSKQLIEKALAGRTDDRWLEFLRIVQASDLSSLANTLDSDLVSFIGRVLD